MAEQREALNRTLTAEDGSNPLVAFQERSGKSMLDSEERNRAEIERLRDQHGKESRVLQEHIAKLTQGDRAPARAGGRRRARGRGRGSRHQQGIHFRGDRPRGHRARSPTPAATAQPTPELRRPRAAARRATPWSSSAHADGPPSGGSSSRPRTRQLVQERRLGRARRRAWRRDAASFGVLVVAGEDKVPSGREQLHEYEGNKLIVAVDRDEPDALCARARLPAGGGAGHDGPRARSRGRCRRGSRSQPRRRSRASSRRRRSESTLTGINSPRTRRAPGLDEMVATLRAEARPDRLARRRRRRRGRSATRAAAGRSATTRPGGPTVMRAGLIV